MFESAVVGGIDGGGELTGLAVGFMKVVVGGGFGLGFVIVS